MKKEKINGSFGSIALEKGFISQDQLDEALRIQKEEDTSTGEHRPIGRILLNEGRITLQQVADILKSMDRLYEEETDKSFGEIAIEKGFITEKQLEEALKMQTLEVSTMEIRRSIGRILLNEGHMTLQQIGEVLKDRG